MPLLYPGRRFNREKAPVRVIRGYYPTEPRRNSKTAAPKDGEDIKQGMALTLDNNGEWVKAVAAASTDVKVTVYVARQDQDDPAVQASGKLTGMELTYDLELQTGYIVAGTFAVDSELTVEADTGNFKLATADERVVAKVSALGTGAGGLFEYTGIPSTETLEDAVLVQFKAAAPYIRANLLPPNPDPMTFDVVPEAVDDTSITMTATVAVDPEGNDVEYYFTCTAGGGNDSGWQSSPTYVDTGLTPATEYTYTVMARDVCAVPLDTAESDPESATTNP